MSAPGEKFFRPFTQPRIYLKYIVKNRGQRVSSGEVQGGQQFFKNWALSNWGLVDRLARNRFKDEVLSEEAALYVLERLEQGEWSLLRKYRGKARLKTYFSSVVYNLLEDFARVRFGRVRPPLWLRKLGGIWLSLYRMLCLERYPYSEATNRAADRYEHLDLDQIERVADSILAALPSCGTHQYLEEPLDEQGPGQPSNPASVQDTVEDKERQLVMKALHDHFFGPVIDHERSRAIIGLLGCSTELKPEERLLLTLCHVEGLGVAEAGKKLGLNRFQAHGKLRRLYGRIRKSFAAGGRVDELRLLLEEDKDTNR